MASKASSSARSPILICYDGSPEAQRAVETAAALFPGRPAVILLVFSRPATHRVRTTSVTAVRDELLEEVRTAARRDAAAIAEEGASLARRAGLEARALATEADGGLPEAVMRVAAEASAVGVILGRRRPPGLRSLRADNLPRRLIDQCPLPLILA